jgi:hypothetical protein
MAGTPNLARQELCSHSFRGVKVGDTFKVTGSSADSSKFVCSADCFLDDDKVAAWHAGEIMAGTATHTFENPGVYVAIVDIAYLAAGAVTLALSVTRPSGETHSIVKTCDFTGAGKGDLDSAVIDVTVA